MSRRVLRALVLLQVLLLGVVIAGCGKSTAPPVRSTFYLAPNGSDANDGSKGSPWLTFNEAYQSVPAGSTVLVGGDASVAYATQDIKADPAKDAATADVTFKRAAGADPHVGFTYIRGAHITIQGLTINGWLIYAPTSGTPAHDITMLNNQSTSYITTGGAHDVLIQGNEIFSRTHVTSDSQNASSGSNINTNVRYVANWFHDFIDTVPGLHHVECLQIGSGVNLKIVNNRFGPNCDTHDLFMRSWGNAVNDGPHPISALVQGNDFEPCRPGCYEFYPEDDLYTLGPTSLDVSWNTFEAGASPIAIGWWGAIKWHNNVEPTMSAFGCGYRTPNTTRGPSHPPSSFMDHNTFYGTEGTGCGTNATVVSTFPGVVKPPARIRPPQ